MKVWNYMMIMLTMMLFLAFVGFPIAAGNSILATIGIQVNSTTGTLVTGDVGNSQWYDNLFNPTTGLLLVVGISGAVIVGFFTKQFDWKLVVVGFLISFVAQFAAVGLSIVQLAVTTGQDWLVAIVATIFLPLTAMFIFSIVEWFAGSDS
jgi:hypothetical protein